MEREVVGRDGGFTVTRGLELTLGWILDDVFGRLWVTLGWLVAGLGDEVRG